MQGWETKENNNADLRTVEYLREEGDDNNSVTLKFREGTQSLGTKEEVFK